MASLYKKVISGKPYWYLREMGWVDGKPRLVSERYLGTAADIEALLDAREAAVLPERTRHLAFGDVAAAWGVLRDLGVAAIIDEVTGGRRADAGALFGHHERDGLALQLVRDHQFAGTCSHHRDTRRPASRSPAPSWSRSLPVL